MADLKNKERGIRENLAIQKYTLLDNMIWICARKFIAKQRLAILIGNSDYFE